jgi:hypothetical protein
MDPVDLRARLRALEAQVIAALAQEDALVQQCEDALERAYGDFDAFLALPEEQLAAHDEEVGRNNALLHEHNDRMELLWNELTAVRKALGMETDEQHTDE